MFMRNIVISIAFQLRRLPRWLLPVVALYVAIFVVFVVRLDPDFGWHLQSGRAILHQGIPSHDIFTYTAANFSWINHEWLSDIFIVGLYALGGFTAVAAGFAFIWTAALIVASRCARWPVLAVAVAAMLDTITARPAAWTALILAVVLLAVRRRVTWPLIPVFVLWANLHGGFVIGLMVLAAYAIRNRNYRWVLLGCITATFINPYGPHVYVEIWRTLTDSELRNNVVEWKPLAVGTLSGLYIVIYLLAGATAGWRREFILPSFFLFSAISSMRQFPLFVVASLGVVEAAFERMEVFLAVKSGWRQYLLPLAALALVAAPVIKVIRHPDNQAPVAAVTALSTKPCTGNLYNDYDFGGYLIWKMPQTKVYIDGRMPSWKLGGESYMENWKRDLTDTVFRRTDFARYNIRCVMVRPSRRQIVRELRADGWQFSVIDSQAILLRQPD